MLCGMAVLLTTYLRRNLRINCALTCESGTPIGAADQVVENLNGGRTN